MIRDQVKALLVDVLGALDIDIEDIHLEHPKEESHGDLASNVAMVVFGRGDHAGSSNPRALAEKICAEITAHSAFEALFTRVEVAGPGFINFFVKQDVLVEELGRLLGEKNAYGKSMSMHARKEMVEFAHPNTHKEMHIGHMRTLILGEALSRIFEANGADVFRANYQGDIGPHVAKCIWGLRKLLEAREMTLDDVEKLDDSARAHLLGEGYVRGNADDADEDEITRINVGIYQQDPEVFGEYQRTRQWSLDYYDRFYERFGTTFNRFYFESQTAEPGIEMVKRFTGSVFAESQGAIIFEGEKHGLHNRVFLTAKGTPTYEGKEIALAPMQFADFAFDRVTHVVANEQAGYFKVVIKALSFIDADLAAREYHLSMGMVNLVGRKISSRKGDVITVDGLLADIKKLVLPLIKIEDLSEAEKDRIAEHVTMAAVKFSVLKTHPEGNVSFDLEQSIRLDGDSGPYVQYVYARCRSVLDKAGAESYSNIQEQSQAVGDLEDEELAVLRQLSRYPEVVEGAAMELAPHMICTYLFELGQRFNSFYNKHSILNAEDDAVKEFRLALTVGVAQVLNNGLGLLAIEAPERM